MAKKKVRPEAEQPEPSPPHKNGTIPIVGIGSSAGGIGALDALLPLFQPGCGLALVVVQHLDPDQLSVLSSVLSRIAKLPVREIEDGMTVEPDRIYIVPRNTTLTISDRRLRVQAPREQRGQRTSIDNFFSSLAEGGGENAAGVILSGTGSDGTLGLRAIKEHGGLTLAQEGAEYDGMVRSAVSSGMVDFVLPIEQIPGKLADYFRHLTAQEELQSIDEELQTVNSELNARVEELSRANSDISNLLESTQIAAVFLDRNLAVKSFTPATKEVFQLVGSDAGRPITHVRARFQPDTVQEDAERVLRTLSTI